MNNQSGNSKRSFVIIGAGGFGQEAAFVAERAIAAGAKYELLGFCDDNTDLVGQSVYGHQVLGSLEQVHSKYGSDLCFVCAIGQNTARRKVVARVMELGWQPISIVDPSVVMPKDFEIGVGCVVGMYTAFSTSTKVHNHVIVNKCCSIGHNAVIEDFGQLAPGARLNGYAYLHEGATVAANGIVNVAKKVGRYATVGSGSFAVRNVPDFTTVLGVPAKVIHRSEPH